MDKKNSAKSLEALVDRLCNVPGCWQDQPDIEIYNQNQGHQKGQTNNAKSSHFSHVLPNLTDNFIDKRLYCGNNSINFSSTISAICCLSFFVIFYILFVKYKH